MTHPEGLWEGQSAQPEPCLSTLGSAHLPELQTPSTRGRGRGGAGWGAPCCWMPGQASRPDPQVRPRVPSELCSLEQPECVAAEGGEQTEGQELGSLLGPDWEPEKGR